jgi:putative NADPH-quinone reductase
MPIYRFETSQEYLKRLQQQWQDAASLQLAATITDSYEKYRYHEQSLSPEELAAMQQAVKSLRETPAT